MAAESGARGETVSGGAQANGAEAQANGAEAQANGAEAQANGAEAQANGAEAQANGAVAASGGPPDPELVKSLPESIALFPAAIQPLLRERCGKCHIKESPAGGLGLEQHAQLLEGGYSGPAVVPKNREQSLVLARLLLPQSDDEHMPPEGEPGLSADEVELVGAWIDQGAPAGEAVPTAELSAGAVRALSARGVRGGPEPLAATSGGCAACSVPGAPRSRWVEAQALSLLGALSLLTLRRRSTRRRSSRDRWA